MARPALTPGRLYALLSAEFRQSRGRSCTSSCAMPLPVSRLPGDEDRPNWSLDAVSLCCEACESLIRDIVQRASGRFDLFDPTSEPFARPHAAQTRTTSPEGTP